MSTPACSLVLYSCIQPLGRAGGDNQEEGTPQALGTGLELLPMASLERLLLCAPSSCAGELAAGRTHSASLPCALRVLTLTQLPWPPRGTRGCLECPLEMLGLPNSVAQQALAPQPTCQRQQPREPIELGGSGRSSRAGPAGSSAHAPAHATTALLADVISCRLTARSL